MNAPPHAFCPHCGSDLKADAPIMLNEFSMFGDGYPLCYNGKPVKLTPTENALIWTLLKAYPNTVRADAMLNRIGSEGNYNTVTVLISRIRRKLKAAAVPNHIETMWGTGVRWSVAVQPYVSNGGGRPRKAEGPTTGAGPSLSAD